ncbi:MAG: hypothetical protein KF699_11835 [Phycisphaeraceae bacterium]|nr:hypothetical protein [Phycisphaeraceae bacterium]
MAACAVIGAAASNGACPGQVPPVEAPEIPLHESRPAHWLTVGIDAVTVYQFRGFVYEDSGPIVQPWAEVDLTVLETDSAAIRLLLSTWHSFHGQATDAESQDGFRRHWFEADASAGIGADLGPWNVTAQYNVYTSPSDAWPTMQEVSFNLSYADDWLPAGWSLNPHALLAFEVGPAANDGMRNGVFLELGVSPTYEFTDGPCAGVMLSFPIALGLSLSNYYEDDEGRNDAFGYVSLGAGATIPLGRTGPANWSLSLGIEALMLGGAAASFNDGERSVLVGSIGLVMEF